MKRNIVEKIYIWGLVRLSRLTRINMYHHYIVVFKYDNKIDYFKHVLALNKMDAKKIIKTLLMSDLYDIKDKKTITIIVIKENEDE